MVPLSNNFEPLPPNKWTLWRYQHVQVIQTSTYESNSSYAFFGGFVLVQLVNRTWWPIWSSHPHHGGSLGLSVWQSTFDTLGSHRWRLFAGQMLLCSGQNWSTIYWFAPQNRHQPIPEHIHPAAERIPHKRWASPPSVSSSSLRLRTLPKG